MSQCATYEEYLVFIIEQNLVGIGAVVSVVMLSSHCLRIPMMYDRAHYFKT